MEAKTTVDAAVELCALSLKERPWDWYMKDAYSGLCFEAAEAWREVGEPVAAQELLRRGWSVNLRQFGRESLLDKFELMPFKGDIPEGATDKERDFFQRFTTKSPRSSWVSRFTIPCEFVTEIYPFHVYVLNGPRGFAELQDQFRWLKEIRGGDVPPEVRDAFLRLNEIASEEDVEFQDVALLLFPDFDKETKRIERKLYSSRGVQHAIDALSRCSEDCELRKRPIYRYCISKSDLGDIERQADETVAEIRAIDDWLSHPTTNVSYRKDRQSDLERLLYIAAENKVKFKELAVYALGNSKTPQQRYEEADKTVSQLKVSFQIDKSEETGKSLVNAYAQKAEALIEQKRFADSMKEFRNGIAVCEKLVANEVSTEWAKSESERLNLRLISSKVKNIATGDMSAILENEAEVIPRLLQVRATELAKEAKPEGVEEAAKQLMQISPRTSETMLNAARAFSLCVGIRQKSEEQNSTIQKQRDQVQHLALECLEEAIDLGYEDFDALDQQDEFNAIRGLPSFRQLIQKKKKEVANDKLSRVIMLVTGNLEDKKKFWTYVAVKPSKLDEFNRLKKERKLDLKSFDRFGELIIAGEGHEPSLEVKKRIAEVYQIDIDSLN